MLRREGSEVELQKHESWQMLSRSLTPSMVRKNIQWAAEIGLMILSQCMKIFNRPRNSYELVLYSYTGNKRKEFTKTEQ